MGIKADPVIEHLRISKMEVDVDKDWDGLGIRRVKELADNMIEGELVARSNSVLTKIPTGDPSTILMSDARTSIPSFQPPV